MSNTTNLILPYLAAAQAQKHVTHNDALRILDALIFSSFKTFQSNTPPGSPADGDRHLTGASPTGVWAGQANKVAAYQDGVWRFYPPKTGWLGWNEAAGPAPVAYDGAAWRTIALLTLASTWTLAQTFNGGVTIPGGQTLNGAGAINLTGNDHSFTSAAAYRPIISATNNANDISCAFFVLQKTRASAPPSANDFLGQFLWKAPRGSDSVMTESCSLVAYAASGTNTNAVPSYWRMTATAPGGTIANVMEIQNTGSSYGLWVLHNIAATSTTTGALRVTGGAGLTGNIHAGGYIDFATELRRAGTKLLEARKTGWGAPTGTATRSTFATGTVTLSELAERMKALIDDLTSHGLIGA